MTRSIAVLVCAVALFAAACGSTEAAASGEIVVSDVWSRQPAAGQPNGVVYGTITNDTDAAHDHGDGDDAASTDEADHDDEHGDDQRTGSGHNHDDQPAESDHDDTAHDIVHTMSHVHG